MMQAAEIDQHLRCPITEEIFLTPVILESEHIIEKAIADKARATTGLNPMTGELLGEYIVNRRMQGRVAQYLKEHPEKVSEQYGYQAPAATQPPVAEAKEADVVPLPADDFIPSEVPIKSPNDPIPSTVLPQSPTTQNNNDPLQLSMQFPAQLAEAEDDGRPSQENAAQKAAALAVECEEDKPGKPKDPEFLCAFSGIAAPRERADATPIKLPVVAAIVRDSCVRNSPTPRPGLMKRPAYYVLCLGSHEAGKTIYTNAAADGIPERALPTTLGIECTRRDLPNGAFLLFVMSTTEYHRANFLLFFATDATDFCSRIRHASSHLDLELFSLDYQQQDDGTLTPVLGEFDQELLNTKIADQSAPVTIFDAIQVQAMSDHLLGQLSTIFNQRFAPKPQAQQEAAPKAQPESKCVLQ